MRRTIISLLIISLVTFTFCKDDSNLQYQNNDVNDKDNHNQQDQNKDKDNNKDNNNEDHFKDNDHNNFYNHLQFKIPTLPPFNSTPPCSNANKCCVPKSTLNVAGVGQVSVRSDTVRIRFSITTTRATASQALSENAAIVNKVTKSLKALKVSDDEISTTNFSVNPHYKVNANGQVTGEIDGFVVTQSIEVVVGDVSQAGKIIDTVVAKGATVDFVSFEVSDKLAKSNRETLINLAIDNAMKKANLTLKKLGWKITGILSVHINDNANRIISRFAENRMATGTNLIGGSKTLSIEIDIVFNIAKK